MSTVHTAHGSVMYATLIPSKGRPEQWRKTLQKMPWLNHPSTFLGLEHDEVDDYDLTEWRGQLVTYRNPQGSVAVAREELRQAATGMRGYSYYVVTDDNAAHPSKTALDNLVRACAEFPTQPCVMAGYHNTAPHFDRGKIARKSEVHGLWSYPSVAMIFQCYPDTLYRAYRYPANSYGLDDRHFALWALSMGAEFRVCMDAPFTKTRYQVGGQGPVEARAMKTGKAIACLATDFPEYVGAVGTLRIPWQFLLDARRQGGMTANRLVGGSMRKEGSLNAPKRIVLKKRMK